MKSTNKSKDKHTNENKLKLTAPVYIKKYIIILFVSKCEKTTTKPKAKVSNVCDHKLKSTAHIQ